MNKGLRWGIVGTGAIAERFATELAFSDSGRLVAVASRAHETARAFAARHPGTKAHGGYAELYRDPEVDAVYVSTPHPFHASETIAALRAGKHVLCEKPLAMSLREAEEVIAEAARSGCFLMEAFMYRVHPRTTRVGEMVRSGALGRVLLIEASFSFSTKFDPASRLFAPELGGGGIRDVGCYTLSVARFIAGAARGRAFENPDSICGATLPAPTGVDLVAAATLHFPSGVLAQVQCGFGFTRNSDLVIHGDGGSIRVPHFWNPPGPIEICTADETFTEPETGSVHKYAVEADVVARSLPEQECDLMSWADSLGNAAALDQWLAGRKA